MYSFETRIETTVSISKGSKVIIPDIDCVALVLYDAVGGEVEWTIDGFEFDGADGRVVVTKDDGPLFNILMQGVDDSHIDEIMNGYLIQNFITRTDDDSGYSYVVGTRSW